MGYVCMEHIPISNLLSLEYVWISSYFIFSFLDWCSPHFPGRTQFTTRAFQGAALGLGKCQKALASLLPWPEG